MRSGNAEHWTHDQLIAHLYGVGQDDGHVQRCASCQARLASMQAARISVEGVSSPEQVAPEFLFAQRRKIYAALEKPTHWWTSLPGLRLASSSAALLVLSGGFLLYQDRASHQRPVINQQVSDAQLALDVSRMSEDPETRATAPLQALFD